VGSARARNAGAVGERGCGSARWRSARRGETPKATGGSSEAGTSAAGPPIHAVLLRIAGPRDRADARPSGARYNGWHLWEVPARGWNTGTDRTPARSLPNRAGTEAPDAPGRRTPREMRRVRAGRPSDRRRTRRLRDHDRCLLGARTLPGVAPPTGGAASFTCLTHLDLAPWRLAQCPRGPPTTQPGQGGKGFSSPDISVDARTIPGAQEPLSTVP
jgi:hypothetical protein